MSLHRHIFGLRTDVRNGVHFVNQSVVAFVAGHNVVLHSLETRSQTFLPGLRSMTAHVIACMAAKPPQQHVSSWSLWHTLSGL